MNPTRDTRPGELSSAEAKRIAAAIGDDMEQRRREAEGGGMEQKVYIEQLVIPWTTKLALGGLLALVTGLVSWNLVTTLAIRESQANDKREIFIEIGKQQGRLDVHDVRLTSAESRLEKLEDRK